MTPTDLLYTTDNDQPMLLSELHLDGLEMVLSFFELGGHNHQWDVADVLEDSADVLAIRDRHGRTWRFWPLTDPAQYNDLVRTKGDRKFPTVAAIRAQYLREGAWSEGRP